MLFAILNKSNNEQKSTNLTAFMVHYLFIEKKWEKSKCIIYSKLGHKMDYETFNKRYPYYFKL